MNNESPAAKLMGDILAMENETNLETVAKDEPQNTLSAAEGAGARQQIIQEQILDTLRSIYDPEIPVNIYELGLIYDVAMNSEGEVYVRMTLTSPACPVAGTLPIEVETKINAIPGVEDCTVEVVWDPPYSMEMMSEAARLQLGLL
jgi:FeS assembly SUF system protein